MTKHKTKNKNKQGAVPTISDDKATTGAGVGGDSSTGGAAAGGGASGGGGGGGDETVDTTGLDESDIKMVMDQAGVGKAQAVKALRAAGGDIVNAIMELTI